MGKKNLLFFPFVWRIDFLVQVSDFSPLQSGWAGGGIHTQFPPRFQIWENLFSGLLFQVKVEKGVLTTECEFCLRPQGLEVF